MSHSFKFLKLEANFSCAAGNKCVRGQERQARSFTASHILTEVISATGAATSRFRGLQEMIRTLLAH